MASQPPSPRQSLNFHLEICLFWTFPTRGTRVRGPSGLAPPTSHTWSRFITWQAVCASTPSLFLAKSDPSVWQHHTSFIHVSADGHPACFYLLIVTIRLL